MLRCSDQSLYTGITNDVEKRIKKHNGELPGGAKYTRGRRPVELVHREEVDTKSDALKREREIKKMKRDEKLELIKKKKEAK